ncbi:hypothetical protein SKP52_08095 [Sphingopyxis fribergensis]|uniref:Autotransporter domain-containing protein n=1 Tax=Sphingopyxis fribergensis TaxID=1515612 RepID=A0A0A7PH27_9SPHN|nr:autotransporter outer membrane beta-barrel domain-containing protein [Sphingopyxis fribergensis]AJA08538.1 hypothetical protein SKP52_08095 [Sphingopyxis fribergensis]
MISSRARRNLATVSMGALATLLWANTAAAQAQDACGTLVDGEVFCPSDGADYPEGIRYDAPGNITLNLQDGLSLNPEKGDAGIIAISEYGSKGSVAINGAGTSISTRDATGVVVEAEGDILIDLASVSTEVVTPGEIAAGITVANPNDSTTINVGSVRTVGDYSSGMVVEHGGPGTVTIHAGSVSTNGFASDGIKVVSGGDTEIVVDTIEGNGDYIWGINATNGVLWEEQMLAGVTSISVGRVNLSGNYNVGVFVDSESSAIVNVGDLNIDGFGNAGVAVTALDTAYVSVENATFTGEQSGGIFAVAGWGNAYARVGTLTAENGGGIGAQSFDGAADVDAGSVHVKGDQAIGAQAASTYGSASLRVQDVSTDGVLATGIRAEATRGEVAIIAGKVVTNGDASTGIFAMGRTNDVRVLGSLETKGERSVGILSATTRGDNFVLTNGRVSTQGESADALWVVGRYGSATILATGEISTIGDHSAGIRAVGEDGQVSIEAQKVTTEGAGANGIHARTQFVEFYSGHIPGEPVPFTGNIDIRAANVAVSGEASMGISARGLGSATILAGNVSAVSGAAIDTDMIENVTLDLRGEIRSQDANAVMARGENVSIEIGADARIVGGQNGLVIDAIGQRCVLPDVGDGSPNPCPNPGKDTQDGQIGVAAVAPPVDFPAFAGNAKIVNRGTIEAGEGFAIRVDRGAIALENSGTITGGLQFAGGDDLFDNAGLFVVTKDSDFGSGTDVLRNSGTLRAGGDVRLNGLERFENSGAIDLRNEKTGDVLTISGDYVGQGDAVVYLDIDGAGRASDRLVIEGSASGSTAIALTTDPTEAKITAAKGVLLVEVEGQSTADAFVLADATRDIGLVRYALTYDAASGSYSLVGRAGAGTFRQLGALQAADHMWDTSADIWRAQGLSRRDALMGDLGTVPRLWGSLQGGRATRDWTITDGDDAIDLDYRQTQQGGQIGYDLFGSGGETGALRVGLTGGYATSKLRYRGGGERIELSTANVGIYAAYVGERLFANLLVKYDHHDVELDTTAFASAHDLDGSTWGADGEVGMRFGSTGMFVEPAVGLAWSATDVDSLGTATQRLEFETSKQVKARIGARFGGTSHFANGGALTLYASGNAVRIFGDDYGLTVTAGESQRIEGDRLGTFGEGRVGLSYRAAGGFEAFAEGQGEIGSGYDGLTGRVGFRIGF